MTIVFLQPDGVPITAQAERQGSAALYGAGSGKQLGGRSGLRVGTATDTLVATSTTWTLKPCSAMIDAGASTVQGMYGWASDANISGSVTAADATYARKDIVYIQVNDSSSGDGSGATSAPVLYLAGTPTATPAAPALPARSFLVGTIDVPKVGGGSPAVTLNPARFVAAGAPLPVASVSERDILARHDGFTVRRMDLPGRTLETWDGAAWSGAAAPVSYLPTAPAGYSWTGAITVEARPGGKSFVTIDLTITKVTSGVNITTSYTGLGSPIPTQARSASVPPKYLSVPISGGGMNLAATVSVNPQDGTVSIRGGSDFTWAAGGLLTINVAYYI